MTVSLNQPKVLLLLFVAVVASIVFVYWVLPHNRVQKRDLEIDQILEKDFKFEACVQYALVARVEGWYMCYNCPTATIYLEKGEVWKYGKTCLGEGKRYPNGLPDSRLRFEPQYFGSEKECLIEEKRKIYDYPALPECHSRGIFLARPPGNKIDR